jgi:hypothetical protein
LRRSDAHHGAAKLTVAANEPFAPGSSLDEHDLTIATKAILHEFITARRKETPSAHENNGQTTRSGKTEARNDRLPIRSSFWVPVSLGKLPAPRQVWLQSSHPPARSLLKLGHEYVAQTSQDDMAQVSWELPA